jgi:hypothetical protein
MTGSTRGIGDWSSRWTPQADHPVNRAQLVDQKVIRVARAGFLPRKPITPQKAYEQCIRGCDRYYIAHPTLDGDQKKKVCYEECDERYQNDLNDEEQGEESVIGT